MTQLTQFQQAVAILYGEAIIVVAIVGYGAWWLTRKFTR